MAETVYESVLPSGRGVRFIKLTTRMFHATNERVAAKMGDRPDPQGSRATALYARDIIAACLRAVTPKPLDWQYEDVTNADGKVIATEPNVDAMLKAAEWRVVNYQELATDGEFGFDSLFDDLEDFTAMSALIQGVNRPFPQRTNALKGKIRTYSTG